MANDKNLSIGGCSLGKKPRIVAIIDRKVAISEVLGLAERGADILEFRLDCFNGPLADALVYVRALREETSFPLIGTIRETPATKEQRLYLFKRLIPLVDCIDIEADAPIAPEVIAMAKGKTILVSEHDFESMPNPEKLNDIADQAFALGANIVKIAAMAKSAEDVRRLFRFTEERADPLVTIAMGPAGAISRVAAPLYGSLFTYAFIADSVAPGQLSLDEIARDFRKFFPDA
jgi:3-dehydroquinate dehydratase I